MNFICDGCNTAFESKYTCPNCGKDIGVEDANELAKEIRNKNRTRIHQG